MNKPKLICLTPVRNEAWVLHAFLQAASLWADHIIIADQGSTDGSREIALSYPKVILIENNDPDLHETNRQRLMLAEARKIEGEKILITLDADEIFTADFMETDDWQKIIHAKAGDVFQFQWVTIDESGKFYEKFDTWFQWAFYDDGSMPSEEGKIHIARVPCPHNSEAVYHQVKDFQVIHLQYLHVRRLKSKLRYYQCFLQKEQHANVISLFRQHYRFDEFYPKTAVPDYFFESYLRLGINIFELIDLSEPCFWQDMRVLEYFDEKGAAYFKKLDIFDKEWLRTLSDISGKEIKDPRKWPQKLQHFYLRSTNFMQKTFLIKGMDKLLKKLT